MRTDRGLMNSIVKDKAKNSRTNVNSRPVEVDEIEIRIDEAGSAGSESAGPSGRVPPPIRQQSTNLVADTAGASHDAHDGSRARPVHHQQAFNTNIATALLGILEGQGGEGAGVYRENAEMIRQIFSAGHNPKTQFSESFKKEKTERLLRQSTAQIIFQSGQETAKSDVSGKSFNQTQCSIC